MKFRLLILAASALVLGGTSSHNARAERTAIKCPGVIEGVVYYRQATWKWQDKLNITRSRAAFRRFHSCAFARWTGRLWMHRARVHRVKFKNYLKAHPVHDLQYWINKQISAANSIGAASHANGGDPWPNCPDPFDGSGSWQDTVNCENTGNWYDSPGYFRCGLQFKPSWETVYGRLCP